MFSSKEEFRKIYDSMNKNYVESVKEYKEYIEKNCQFYLSRRKHMKNYITKKLIDRGYEITEQTQKALMQISRACKTYAIHNNGKDLFEVLLLGNEDIMYRYLVTMANLEISKDYKQVLSSVKSDLEKLSKDIEKCKNEKGVEK